MNILIVRVSSIGDVVHTIPSLFLLKRLYPTSKISWIVQKKAASILKDQPLLENVWVIPDKFLQSKNWLETLQVIKEVRKMQWDAILDFQGIIKTSLLLACLKGAKFGFDARNARSWISSLFTHHHISPQYINIIQKNLSLASNIPLREKAKKQDWIANQYINSSPLTTSLVEQDLEIPTKQKESVDHWLTKSGLNNFIAIAPNTTWASKLWPIKNWQELILTYSRIEDNRPLVLIGRGFGEHADKIFEYAKANKIRVHDAPKEWNMLANAYLISKSDLLVAPDTGMLHLADLFKTKAIGIFGPTSCKIHGPFWVKENIENCIQLPCKHRYSKTHGSKEFDCMAQLTPRKLIEKIEKVMLSS